MKIVVTGALGHIGSRLIRELRVDHPDAEIVLLDNMLTQRYCSLFNLPTSGRYTFLEEDVLTTDLLKVVDGADVTVHLAAITNATDSFEIRDQVMRVNLGGTERIAKACARTGCALIFLSTTSVYGSQSQTVDEQCPRSDLKPQSPYAESKLEAELLLQQLRDTEQLHHVTCRFGTIFGTSIGMRFHTAINKFCWQAVTRQPITVWTTALHQHRPYLELGDAVEAIKFIIRQQLFDGEIYNVLTTNTSVGEIVEVISSFVSDTTIEYVDTRIMNQLSYNVSNARFRNLGFEFKGDLRAGISQTIELLKGVCQWRENRSMALTR